ncbi:hypothetical protein V2A20_33450, partial [Pseudomonas aeruginosa]
MRGEGPGTFPSAPSYGTQLPKNRTTETRSGSWLSVIALARAAFNFNTTEIVPVGLLSDIGHSYEKPTSQGGRRMT